MGTADHWEAATMGFQNVCPNYWNGEEGRKNLISGKEKLSNPQYVKVFEHMAKWGPYMGRSYQSQKYSDSQNIFTLGGGDIYPTGSWEINGFNKQADFEFGAFYPPTPEGQDSCYISDHTDIAMGMNANSKNTQSAKVFLNWMTSKALAEFYSNQLPSFFSLSKDAIDLKDPAAQEFLNWRGKCKQTLRNSYQILSRGEPNLESELWNVSVQVLNGTMAPEAAAEQAQKSHANWYKPQQ